MAPPHIQNGHFSVRKIEVHVLIKQQQQMTWKFNGISYFELSSEAILWLSFKKKKKKT